MKMKTLNNVNLNTRLGIIVTNIKDRESKFGTKDPIALARAGAKENNKYEVCAKSIKKYIAVSARSKTNDIVAKLTFYKDGNKLSKRKQKALNETVNLINYRDIRFGALVQDLMSTKHLSSKRKEPDARVSIPSLDRSGY